MIAYFKLSNSIKSKHEAADLARLELESLLGQAAKIQTVNNFIEEFAQEPLRAFINGSPNRFQDVVAYELPYGRIQGYKTELDNFPVPKLARRLAYTREIYIVDSGSEPDVLLSRIFPCGKKDMNVETYKADGYVLLRVIVNQYYLEKSQYVSKLSRNEQEIESNASVLLHYPISEIYRIPASSTLSVGKRLQDYFAIREEPSLYLTHYMHPYKGKFHPRMARALLNIVMPQDDGLVMDNFAGSGTLLVEASLMGLRNVGVEINPLSVLMSKVKCECLFLSIKELRRIVADYINRLRDQGTLLAKEPEPTYEVRSVDEVRLERYMAGFSRLAPSIRAAQRLLPGKHGDPYHDFLLLALSGTISDMTRRTSVDFVQAFENRVLNLYRRICLFKALNKTLGIVPARSMAYVGDARSLPKSIEPGTIAAIVNSPPYSVALDYIKNDFPQLVLLKLANSINRLERDMMGNPRVNYDRHDIMKRMESDTDNPLKISQKADISVSLLMEAGRLKEAFRCFKFFDDMLAALKEMHRSLEPSGRAAVVIGRNNFKVNGKYHNVPNDDIIEQLAAEVGLNTYCRIDRELQKTSAGNIRKEAILFLKKS